MGTTNRDTGRTLLKSNLSNNRLGHPTKQWVPHPWGWVRRGCRAICGEAAEGQQLDQLSGDGHSNLDSWNP